MTMASPVAMISYSWADSDAAELLHDEFALRGFSVIHDRYSFTDGSRIPANMTNAVAACDVFVAYLTPNSLYLNRSADKPRPALVGELRPALRRRRENLEPGAVDTPTVLPLAHGLGDRSTAAETIRQQTGEDVASLWTTTWLNQTTPHITQLEAASVAANALDAATSGRSSDATSELFVATRGATPPSRRHTIDGTRLLGGDRTAGDPGEWTRLFAALTDVERHLSATSHDHSIIIDPRCHLSAALATGRIFHQATRWSTTFTSRNGPVEPLSTAPSEYLNGNFDQYNETGDLIVDIDFLGHNVGDRTDQLAADLPPAGGRISLSRKNPDGDLSSDEIAHAARWSANLIRKSHAKLRPTTIHITQAAPAAFAGLLGHHLTALNADITSYELDHDGQYIPALSIPCTTP